MSSLPLNIAVIVIDLLAMAGRSRNPRLDLHLRVHGLERRPSGLCRSTGGALPRRPPVCSARWLWRCDVAPRSVAGAGAKRNRRLPGDGPAVTVSRRSIAWSMSETGASAGSHHHPQGAAQSQPVLVARCRTVKPARRSVVNRSSVD